MKMKIPDLWRIAFIILVFKKENRDDASNYRLVSLTGVACKVMEGICGDVMLDFLVI